MDFTKYDFDNLVTTATTSVQNSTGWGQGYSSSFGQTLIQVLAQMCDELNYMLERRSQENFMLIAKLQTSIWALASSIGYRPTRKISASGDISIQLTDVNGIPTTALGNVTIPKYTQLTYLTNNFVNVADITIPTGQSTPSINNIIKEGLIKTMTVNPLDTTTTLYQSDYVLLTDFMNVENTSIIISDANGLWYDVTTSINGATPIGALSFAASTDRVYDIKMSTTGLRIVFGDGTNGLAPTIPLTIQWIVSSGAATNIVTTGLSFQLPTQTLTDDLNNIPPDTYYYSITNSTVITGGLDEESITSIQNHAPDFVRSANRAVTNGDYAFWTKKSGIGGIVDAVAYGQQEAGVNPYQMNNVYITYLTKTASTLSTADADSLRNYLANVMNMTSYIVLQPATVIPVQVALRIKKNPNLTMANSQYYDLINQGVQAFFPLTEGSLGESVDLSSIIRYFMDYQVTTNGINVSAAQWVSIVMNAMFAVTSPITTNNIKVTISSGLSGDTYTIVINGISYSVLMGAGQNAAQIANALIAVLPSAVVTATNTVSASNPGSVTSVTVTAEGSGYTSQPTVSFSSGSAAATAYLGAITATVSAGGSGYSVNDTITLSNGVVLKVATLSGSAVATATIQTAGTLSGTMASNPVSQTSSSGSGTGATFNLTYGVSSLTVTNGGSGYTAAPTCSFSGGGGSGTTATPVVSGDIITIVNSVPQTSFTIGNDGSTVPTNVGITQKIQLPPYLFSNQNTTNQQLFYPGSVNIVNATNGNVLYTDNGSGSIAGGTINYVTGEMDIPILSQGNYYVIYRQDVDENLYSNNQCTFEYSPPPPSYGSAAFAFSSITIL